MRFTLFCLLFFSSAAFGQLKKRPVVHYTNIYGSPISVGDRIDMGEVDVIILPLGKDSISIPDSVSYYRDFIQQHPEITFKLHFLWKNQGVKFPARTNDARDAVLDFLNEDGPDEDSTCYISAFKHTFVKQEPILRIELEVIDVKSHPAQGVIGLPQQNLLYRNYDNPIEFTVNAKADSSWIEGVDVVVRPDGNGRYLARVTGTSRNVNMIVKSRLGNVTTEHGVFAFRVANLPTPSIYFGWIRSTELPDCSEKDFLTAHAVFVKYPAEVSVITTFDVRETVFTVGGTTIVSPGKSLSKEFIEAYEQADKGTEMVIESVQITGPNGVQVIYGPFKHVKQSEKGTPFTPQESNSCKG